MNRVRTLALPGLVLALLVAIVPACGGDDGGAPTTVTPTTVTPTTGAPETSAPETTVPPDTTLPPETTAAPTTTEPVAEVPAVVFFAKDEVAAPVRRFVTGDDVLAATIEAWLAGPTDEERAGGYGTTVPEGTRLLGVSVDTTIEGTLVTVDLSGEFASGGGTLSVLMRLAELVTTATVAAEADGVVLLLDGELVETFTGEGVMIDAPLTLLDVDGQLPILWVHSVFPGDEVRNPLQLAGGANVFEAVVSVQVLDDQGNSLVDTVVMATCGTGCRGTFDAEIEVEEYLGPAVLRVFEVSPADGSEQHAVEIPITIV
jgi:hypothetical protein